MIVHYVIQETAPDSPSSDRRGLQLVDSRDRAEDAEALAELFNSFANCPGIRYFVLPHDECRHLPADIYVR